MTPFMHGYFSYGDGLSLKANPYYCGTRYEENEWIAGWTSAQSDDLSGEVEKINQACRAVMPAFHKAMREKQKSMLDITG